MKAILSITKIVYCKTAQITRVINERFTSLKTQKLNLHLTVWSVD